MNNLIVALILFCLGVLSYIAGGRTVINSSTYLVGEEAKKLIENCEKKLPRDQVCELQAVPAKVEGVK